MHPADSEIARWFEDEVRPHEKALRAYLHGLVAACDVDDLVQETYLRIVRARDRGHVVSPRGLMFATARNVARDLFRRRAAAPTTLITENGAACVFDSAPAIPEAVSRRQEAEMLEDAIAALPPRCREILLLRKFENLSHREIAQKLGIAEHTVEVQLTKALHRCEDYFARQHAL